MATIIDKRFMTKNTQSGSRGKFIEKHKEIIKQKIRDSIIKGNLKDFDQIDKKIKIKAKDLSEPEFGFQEGTGSTDQILTGNKKYKKGDEIIKPSGGQGAGKSKGGTKGPDSDDFTFILTQDEFNKLFFEDLALPDFIKKALISNTKEIKHAGYTRHGSPSALNIKKTMLNLLGRRFSTIGRLTKKLKLTRNEVVRTQKLPKLDDIDVRYNFKDKLEVPCAKAVMFCLLDVSGSMGEKEKDLAKRFFILLNLFLEKNYDLVDIVFVRHSDTAEEVDEKTFFFDPASGGTIISTGYSKINSIIKDRYNPSNWNIYVAQASDGDNYENDMEDMEVVLTRDLLPVTQYFSYIEIENAFSRFLNIVNMDGTDDGSDVLKLMEKLMQSNRNLNAKKIKDYKDIYPVFRELFKKKG